MILNIKFLTLTTKLITEALKIYDPNILNDVISHAEYKRTRCPRSPRTREPSVEKPRTLGMMKRLNELIEETSND